MKKIDKSGAPKFFRDFIRRNDPVNWDGIHEIKHGLREHILKREQGFKCAYCESAITSDNTKSHIDHFKRKHYFPKLTFDYNNLLVSCNNYNHCASVKDSKVKSKDYYKDLTNPVNDDPSQTLRQFPTARANFQTLTFCTYWLQTKYVVSHHRYNL